MPGIVSQHAAKRMQQRAIPAAAIDLLLDYGTSKRSHGADRFYFDRAARRRLVKDFDKEAMRNVGRLLNAYAVVGDDGVLVTAAWRIGRFWNA